MSDKLNELYKVKSDYLTKLKKVKLIEAGVDITAADTYIKYISAEKPEEIEKQVQELIADIKQHNTAKDNKKIWRPF